MQILLRNIYSTSKLPQCVFKLLQPLRICIVKPRRLNVLVAPFPPLVCCACSSRIWRYYFFGLLFFGVVLRSTGRAPRSSVFVIVYLRIFCLTSSTTSLRVSSSTCCRSALSRSSSSSICSGVFSAAVAFPYCCYASQSFNARLSRLPARCKNSSHSKLFDYTTVRAAAEVLTVTFRMILFPRRAILCGVHANC